MADESLRSLAEQLQAICLARTVTVAAAESCTGGLVAGAITDVSGSSGYFRGGVVVYANEAKMALLGVPASMLGTHGAVSAQVARAMAAGIRERLETDLAVAVTGVAGPGGGTASKPVGLTYIAVSDAAGVIVQRFVWPGDREANRTASVRAALSMLIQRATTPQVVSATADPAR
jgi:PncC family amidohydrolase